MSISAHLFCELFNAVQSDLQLGLHAKVLEYIRLYRSIGEDGKGHLAAGFRLDEYGHLLFDDDLYSEQLFPGENFMNMPIVQFGMFR